MNIKTLSLSAMMSLALAIPAVYAADDTGDMGKDATGSSDPMEQQTGAAGQGARSATFDELDTNQDGVITEDELNVYGSTAAGNPDEEGMSGQDTRDMMIELDQDSDGQLTQDEFESME